MNREDFYSDEAFEIIPSHLKIFRNSTVTDSVKKPKIEIKTEPEVSEQEPEMDHPSETDQVPTNSSQVPSDSLHESSIDSFHQISSDIFRVDTEPGVGTPEHPSDELASRSLQMNASLQMDVKGCLTNQVSPYLSQIEVILCCCLLILSYRVSEGKSYKYSAMYLIV